MLQRALPAGAASALHRGLFDRRDRRAVEDDAEVRAKPGIPVPPAGAGPQWDQVEEVEEEMSADISTKEGLFAVMRQVAAEREAAKPMVAELMAREELPWDEEIPEEWRTVGFVEELTKAANALVEKAAPRTLQILQFGLSVMSSCEPETYPRLMFGQQNAKIWIDITFANRYLTAYDEALRSCERAYVAAGMEPALVYDHAIATFHHASVLGFMRSLDDAVNLLAKCKGAFEELGDKRRSLRCDLVSANILHWRGELASALECLKNLVPMVVEYDDAYTLGGVYNNIGQTAVKLGRLDQAQKALRRAIEIHESAGLDTEVDRAKWGLGLVALERGEYRRALTLLGRCRDAFLEREMVEDAGQIGLDMVDALVASGSSVEARNLAHQVLDEFTSANLSQNIIRAVGYLQNLSYEKPSSRDVIKRVRRFVDDARTEGDQKFLELEN
jgi:tetratricopeptide (TPR) repeat protein